MQILDVPRGHLADVITYLEMTRPAPPRPGDLPPGVTLERVPAPDVRRYRDLFLTVGGPWLWTSRLILRDVDLTAILIDPDVWVHVVRHADRDAGILELDFREPGACELAFFGVTDALIGTTAARAMMNAAISLAWSRPITRFHVHTCTLDHPAALGFYRRSGFVPVRQEVEIGPDPRLTGELERDISPTIPLFDP